METPSYIPLESVDDVLDIPETRLFCSGFDPDVKISLPLFLHLLQGKPVLDISDGEYIHLIQFDKEVIQFIMNNYKIKLY